LKEKNTYKSRWLTPKAKAYKSSSHGIGIKSIAQIEKGEIVSVLGGIIVPRTELDEYREKMDHIGIQVNDDFFICPSTRDEINELGAFNHSCHPNVGYTDSLTLIAIENIPPKTELSFDYAFSETMFEPFRCKCGSKNCRKKIKPSDWKLAEIQESYLDYFSPYLKDKIEKSKARSKQLTTEHTENTEKEQ